MKETDMEIKDYAVNAAEYLMSSGLDGRLSEKSKNMFISTAREFRLNPYRRELHCINIKPDGDCQLCTGYGVYIRRSEETGKLDGWKSWTEGEGSSLRAAVEIHRNDWSHPFVHEVYFKEAAPINEDGSVPSFWEKMPRFQLKKVAISQGFRLCFPEELGGMPYELSELAASYPSAPESSSAVKKPIPLDGTVREALAAKAAGHETSSGESHSDSPAMAELDRYLDDNRQFFTDRHIAWIKGKLAKDSGSQQISKMLSYAKKVVRGDSGGNSSGRRFYRLPDTSGLTPSPAF